MICHFCQTTPPPFPLAKVNIFHSIQFVPLEETLFTFTFSNTQLIFLSLSFGTFLFFTPSPFLAPSPLGTFHFFYTFQFWHLPLTSFPAERHEQTPIADSAIGEQPPPVQCPVRQINNTFVAICTFSQKISGHLVRSSFSI